MFEKRFKTGICLITAFLIACPAQLGAQAPPEAGVSSLEPSDEYRPDGYYEPYDFSFVKTPSAPTVPQTPPQAPGGDVPAPPANQNQAGNQVPPAPQPPAYDPPPAPAPPIYEPPPLDIPEAPDFNGGAVAPPQTVSQPVMTNFDINAVSSIPPATPPTAPVKDPASQGKPATGQQPAQQQGKNPRQAGQQQKTVDELLRLFVKKQKPLRYKFKDPSFSGPLDNIINGEFIADPQWSALLESVKKYYNDAITNTISAEATDEEFERINSVLYTYICGGAFGPHESAIVKYRSQYFAFFGPLTTSIKTLGAKNDNSEERYKLLRLLGGDIIKVVSDRLFIFSLKPLSLCVNDIMREVGNGEYYKIEVLFRVMTSADVPVRNLVRPFFQLLKAKIGDAYNTEKNAVVKNNFSKAFEMLSKIQ